MTYKNLPKIGEQKIDGQMGMGKEWVQMIMKGLRVEQKELQEISRKMLEEYDRKKADSEEQ